MVKLYLCRVAIFTGAFLPGRYSSIRNRPDPSLVNPHFPVTRLRTSSRQYTYGLDHNTSTTRRGILRADNRAGGAVLA